MSRGSANPTEYEGGGTSWEWRGAGRVTMPKYEGESDFVGWR